MQELHTLLLEWNMFYLLLGGAGATLAGLMFIAITLSERHTNQERLPIFRAHLDPALLALVFVLVLSAFLLMPTLTRFSLGVVLIAAGLAGLVGLGAAFYSIWTRNVRGWDASDWLGYAVAPVASYLLLLVSSGLALSAHTRDAVTTVGVTLVLLLCTGVRNAWDLVTVTIKIGTMAASERAALTDPPQPAGGGDGRVQIGASVQREEE